MLILACLELKDIVVEDSFEDYYDSSDYWDSLESDISNSGPSPDIAATNTGSSIWVLLCETWHWLLYFCTLLLVLNQLLFVY